jgi:hypothetical protein
MVTGTIGRLGSSFVVSLSLIDGRDTRVLRRVSETFRGDATELRHALELSAHRLFDHDIRRTFGELKLSFNVPKGSVRLGEHRFAVDQHELWLAGLGPGRYELSFHPADGRYLPVLGEELYVPAGATNVRTIELPRGPRPWYQRWPLWLAGAVVLAGAVGYVAVRASSKPDSPVIRFQPDSAEEAR